jgi:hypothetical protein
MAAPLSIDQAAIDARKPRAGPLLEPAEVIAATLTTVEWRPPKKMIEPDDPVVRLVLEGLRLAGWKIEPR